MRGERCRVRFRGTPLLVLGAARGYIIPRQEVMRTAYGTESRILPDIAHDLMLDTGWRPAADALLARSSPDARLRRAPSRRPMPWAPIGRPARARCPGDWGRPPESGAARRWCPT